MKLPKELQNKKKKSNDNRGRNLEGSWELKWTFIINRIEHIIGKKNTKMVLINVEAMKNPKKQFEKYMKTCELVKNRFEVVVSTSLPGEERIFWPSQDVQFYIREGDERIHSTGNSKVIQQVFNASDEPINTDVPDIDFWKHGNFIFCLDNYRYVDESKLFDKDFNLNLPELIKKYRFQQTQKFGNKQSWYLLKFLFIASTLSNLDGMGNLIGGVPKNLKIKCSCGNIISQQWSLKGIFELRIHKHGYYLYISERCGVCGTIICIYRDKDMEINEYFFPIRIFMNFIDPKWNYDFDNADIAAGWQEIFKKAASKDMERIQRLYPQDIIKFGMLLQEMEHTYSSR